MPRSGLSLLWVYLLRTAEPVSDVIFSRWLCRRRQNRNLTADLNAEDFSCKEEQRKKLDTEEIFSFLFKWRGGGRGGQTKANIGHRCVDVVCFFCLFFFVSGSIWLKKPAFAWWVDKSRLTPGEDVVFKPIRLPWVGHGESGGHRGGESLPLQGNVDLSRETDFWRNVVGVKEGKVLKQSMNFTAHMSSGQLPIMDLLVRILMLFGVKKSQGLK